MFPTTSAAASDAACLVIALQQLFHLPGQAEGRLLHQGQQVEIFSYTLETAKVWAYLDHLDVVTDTIALAFHSGRPRGVHQYFLNQK